MPDSHFHMPSILAWLKDHDLSADNYANEHEMLVAVLEAAIAYGTGETGIFGLRLQRHSFDFFLKKLRVLHPTHLAEKERLQAAFGQILFIYLKRTNKVEQAVSRLKAEQTGLWHKTADGKELERLSAPREPIYDATEIKRLITEMTLADEGWEAWFKREKVTPLHICYKALSQNPTGILSHILEELGLDKSIAVGISPPTAKLSDEISKSWVKQFQAENSN